jgi:hypothetical protein
MRHSSVLKGVGVMKTGAAARPLSASAAAVCRATMDCAVHDHPR